MGRKKSWWKLQVDEEKAEKKYYLACKRITEVLAGQLCPSKEDIVKKLKRQKEHGKGQEADGILSRVCISKAREEKR